MNHLNIKSEGEGAPILLVNGLIHDLTTWNYHARILSKRNRVVRFDFPNQGGSPDDSSFLTVDQQSQVVAEVIERANLDSTETVVVAQSSGAGVIRNLHCNLGMDFKQLILLGMNPGGLFNFYSQLYNGYLSLLRTAGVRAYYRSIAPMLFSPLFFEEHPEALEGIINNCEETYAHRMSALDTLVQTPFHDHTASEPPTSFSCNTALLYGDLDYLVPAEKREAYFDRCTQDNIVKKVVSGGHCFAFEKPEVLIDEIRRLITMHSGVSLQSPA